LTFTPAQVECLQQAGYLSLPATTTPAEVAGLRDIYDWLFATQAGRAQGDHLDLSGTDEDGAPVHPRIGEDDRIDEDDVGHRQIGRRAGDDLGAQIGAVEAQLEKPIDRCFHRGGDVLFGGAASRPTQGPPRPPRLRRASLRPGTKRGLG
jgi:hypothetical protein